MWLFLGALLAFAFSTVAGGGGAMILLPLTSSLMGPDKAAPIIQLGNFVGRPTRLLLFWKHIHWRIVKWYLPLALIGAFLGAWLFSAMKIDWLQLVIGGFLVSTFWQFRFGKKKSSFPMKIQWFAPLGLGVAFLSSLVGATGPILNPFYMNYGVKKEELVATKAANSFFIAMVQLPTYAFFGALEGDMWWYGLSLGAGAAIGNWIGKKWLKRTSDLRFRQYLIWTMVIIGVIMIVKWFLN
ncbi:MAG: sulfite exporter TauE/SafE family protein [Bacteroidota bacterium]